MDSINSIIAREETHMRRGSRFVVLAVCLLTLPVATVRAVDSTPQVVNVQGYLSQGGIAVTGTVNMTFSLFDAETAGAMVGSVGPLSVEIDSGIYQVEIPFSADQFTGPVRYLEVGVNGQTLAPRLRLSGTPFAYVADTLDGVDVTELARPAEIASAVADHAASPDPHTVYIKKGGDTATGTLRLSPASGAALITTGGNVGLGISTPTAMLDVAGVIASTTGGFRFPDGTTLASASLAAGVTLDQAYDKGGAGAGRIITADAGAVNIAGTGGLTVSGNVGIGTTTPASKLTVAGVVRSTTGGFTFPDGTTQTSAASSVQYFVACRNGGAGAVSCPALDCGCGTGSLVSRNYTSPSIPGTCTVAVPTAPSVSCQATSVTGGVCGTSYGLGSCCLCRT